MADIDTEKKPRPRFLAFIFSGVIGAVKRVVGFRPALVTSHLPWRNW